jgi:hypothetical protein
MATTSLWPHSNTGNKRFQERKTIGGYYFIMRKPGRQEEGTGKREWGQIFILDVG